MLAKNMKLLPMAIVYTIVGTAAVVFGFYQYLFLKLSPYLGPNGAGYSLWGITFFGFPLIALAVTLLLLDGDASSLVTILALIGSLPLSVAIHQIIVYPIIHSAPPLYLTKTAIAAFTMVGILLLAASLFTHIKTRKTAARAVGRFFLGKKERD